MKARILHIKDIILKKYWPDPVWSKVIATGIIAILTTIYLFLKSVYNQISFNTSFQQLIQYFWNATLVNNFILWFLIIVAIFASLKFLKSFINDIIVKITASNKVIDKTEEMPTISEHSTAFFSYRLAKAFPGQRGIMWYESKLAVERLKIMLQKPLRFKSGGEYYTGDPIWWFRGGSSMFIDEFKPLSKTKILIGIKELEIKRIAVCIDESYYKSFIYLEAQAEKPTGLYNTSEDDIQRYIEQFGYYSEEFGLLGKTPIRREEYDDGATVIKGKVIDSTNAELRIRFISEYNLIIAAKQSPYNSHRFSRETGSMFNKLLTNEMKPEDFFDYLASYEKNAL